MVMNVLLGGGVGELTVKPPRRWRRASMEADDEMVWVRYVLNNEDRSKHDSTPLLLTEAGELGQHRDDKRRRSLLL